MGFAIVGLLVVLGLLALAWSMLAGVALIASGVWLHTKIHPGSEERLYAFMFLLAGIGVCAEFLPDLWRRLFG